MKQHDNVEVERKRLRDGRFGVGVAFLIVALRSSAARDKASRICIAFLADNGYFLLGCGRAGEGGLVH